MSGVVTLNSRVSVIMYSERKCQKRDFRSFRCNNADESVNRPIDDSYVNVKMLFTKDYRDIETYNFSGPYYPSKPKAQFVKPIKQSTPDTTTTSPLMTTRLSNVTTEVSDEKTFLSTLAQSESGKFSPPWFSFVRRTKNLCLVTKIATIPPSTTSEMVHSTKYRSTSVPLFQTTTENIGSTTQDLVRSNTYAAWLIISPKWHI